MKLFDDPTNLLVFIMIVVIILFITTIKGVTSDENGKWEIVSVIILLITLIILTTQLILINQLI